MNITDNLLCCEEVNGWDMVNYLSELGHEPYYIRGNNYWYLSPLRDERTASFKVCHKRNVWYDHGAGEGGTVIDFCLRYYGCNVKDLLFRLSEGTARPVVFDNRNLRLPEDPNDHIQIEKVLPITTGYLKHYLSSRNIPLKIGQQYCVEAFFSIHRKTYQALGFLNRSGGYELRNAWFKGGSAPKDITLIQTGSKKVSLFEGFFDFLSYQTTLQKTSVPCDFLILNSTAFISRSMSLLKAYSKIDLYLDWGPAAQKQTEQLLTQFPNAVDKSNLYKAFDDLNEWHCQTKKPVRQFRKSRLQQ